MEKYYYLQGLIPYVKAREFMSRAEKMGIRSTASVGSEIELFPDNNIQVEKLKELC